MPIDQNKLWSPDARERLSAAKSLDSSEVQTLSANLLSKSLFPGKWPFGMPTSINPWLLFIGISPGGGDDDGSEERTGPIPTIASPNEGFCGPYKKNEWDCPYWEKVRALSSGLIGALYPELSESDCLAISGQLNLGLRNQGHGTESAICTEVSSWASTVIATQLKPRVIIGFGLRSLIEMPKLKEAWSTPSPFSTIRETKPFLEERLDIDSRKQFRFRIWKLNLDGQTQSLFVLWPNHPSRYPFRGDSSKKPWQQAIKQCAAILKTEMSKPPS